MSDTEALKMEFDNLCRLWGDLGVQIDTLQAKRREVAKRMDQANRKLTRARIEAEFKASKNG